MLVKFTLIESKTKNVTSRLNFWRKEYTLFLPHPLSPGGTAAAASFRPSDPALCVSCPLVTPYYCRLGDLLFLLYMCILFLCVTVYVYVWFVVCVVGFFLCSFFLQYFNAVGWGFLPVKTVSHITYTVLVGTENATQSNPTPGLQQCHATPSHPNSPHHLSVSEADSFLLLLGARIFRLVLVLLLVAAVLHQIRTGC